MMLVSRTLRAACFPAVSAPPMEGGRAGLRISSDESGTRRFDTIIAAPGTFLERDVSSAGWRKLNILRAVSVARPESSSRLLRQESRADRPVPGRGRQEIPRPGPS